MASSARNRQPALPLFAMVLLALAAPPAGRLAVAGPSEQVLPSASTSAPGEVPQDWKWLVLQSRLTGRPLPHDWGAREVSDPEPPARVGDEASGALSDAAWSEIAPPALWLHTTVYDPAGDRLIVFGGVGYRGPSSDSWELQLSGSPRWRRLETQGAGPSARSIHTAVYDPGGGRMVVFGGHDGAAYQNDVWGLSLTGPPTWTRIEAPGGPSPRGWHAAVHDPLRGRMVVFGGTNGPARFAEVWALSLDGAPEWTQLAPTGGGPGPRSTLPAVYDPPRDRVVFYGGIDGTSTTRTDVWALALAGTPAWSEIVPAGAAPSQRNGASAIYDPARQRMVLFAGGTGAPNTNETWGLGLSGTPAWTLLSPANPPQGRQFHTAVHDPIGDRMLVFGGSSGFVLSGTWALSLSATETWIPLSGTRRRGHLEIYDPQRHRMVVFAGDDGGPLNDVWQLTLGDPPTWLQLNPAGTPPGPRVFHAGVYDPLRDRLVVFGGRGTSPQNDVWELSFSGAVAWRRLFPDGSAPAPRIDHAAVYDPGQRRMIVFGGAGDGGAVFNDVWALSLAGSPAWTKLSPTGTAPNARGAAVAVYDESRARMVVFGGYDRNLLCFNDCWALSVTGTPAWTCLLPGGGPPPARLGAAAIYDPRRDRLLVSGGTDLSASFSDTWELALAGSPAWQELAPAGVAPLQRSDHRAIYDPVDDRMVFFGGGGLGGGMLNDTWALRFLPTVDVAGPLTSGPHAWPAAPNPTRGPTRFEFELPTAAEASIALYGVNGRLVRELRTGPLPAGRHSVTWDGADARGTRVPAGVYLYRVSLGGARRDGKIVILD